MHGAPFLVLFHSNSFNRMPLSKLLAWSASLRRRQSIARASQRKRRVTVESLEHRRLLASFAVVTAGDFGEGTCTSIQCTLRDAITAANGTTDVDEILFDPAIRGAIQLSSAAGALQISGPVSILGPGANQLTIQPEAASGDFRLFNVAATAGDVSIAGLTITGGRVPAEEGGAIRFQSAGTLSIRSSIISGNVAAAGGAIHSYQGNIEIIDSTISGNAATYGAGGGVNNVDGNITVRSSVIDNNTSAYSGGGMIARYGGNITITDSEVTNNEVMYAGYYGGGISSGDGSVTITGSTITGNVAAGYGGGLYNYSGLVTISSSTVSGNDAAEIGGAILNEAGSVSLTDTTIANNQALNGYGGGISTGSGNLTLTRSTVSGNQSLTDGGGIATNRGGIVLFDSTVSGNTAGGAGGGISSLVGSLSLTNVTISANTAAAGGGIQSTSAPVRIINSTVTGNHAEDTGGGIALTANNDGESLVLNNSIVAQNTATSSPDFNAPADPQTNLAVESSLIGDNAGTSLSESALIGGAAQPDTKGNLIGGGGSPAIDPLLGPLAANGGATTTHALQPESPAIDRGDRRLLPADTFDLDGDGDTAEPLPTDQRGAARVSGSGVDMGAFEIEVIATLDFGDAADRYPVTLASDGARHVVGSLRLGTDVDPDADGQPSDLANGDGQDDDGVFVIADAVADVTTDTKSSFLVIASSPALLDAWIDFNTDGDWDDAGEQIAANVSVSAGANAISYTIVAGSIHGETAARFRLSSAGNLAPTGAAADGEVEDYLVAILDGSAMPDVAVTLPSVGGVIHMDPGQVIVSDGTIDLLRVPTVALSQLAVDAGDGDDTLIIDSSNGDPPPSGGLRLDGSLGDNTLALIGQYPDFDFTSSGQVIANNFANIDLSDGSSNVIKIDALAVNRFSATDRTVMVVGGDEDAIIFADAGDWRMTDPLIVDGRFIRTVTNLVGGQIVRVDLPNPWQNPINPSDIGNDGSVTAGDALRVINELGRRAFSDASTQYLDDAFTTTPWPGVYYDQNGDGRATALDALRVINQLARNSVGGSGEQASVPLPAETNGLVNAQSISESLDERTAAVDRVHHWVGAVAATSRLDVADSWWLASSERRDWLEKQAELVVSPRSVDRLLTDESFLDHPLG